MLRGVVCLSIGLGVSAVGTQDTTLVTHTSLVPPPVPYPIANSSNSTTNVTVLNDTGNLTFNCMHVCDGLTCKQGFLAKANPETCACECVSTAHILPRNGRVALLLRGEAFRDSSSRHPEPCLSVAKDNQFNAARSMLDQIVGPLEEANNKVEIIASEDGNSCGLIGELFDTYKRSRIVAEDSSHPFDGQASSMRHVLDLFKQYMINRQEPGNMNGTYDETKIPYDLVMIARHDMSWKVPITSWAPPADFNLFNFLSRCEKSHKYGDACVNDAFFMMPARLFPKFDAAVGSGDCFAALKDDQSKQNGHLCYAEVTSRTSEEVAYITNWRPVGSLKEVGNPVVEFI